MRFSSWLLLAVLAVLLAREPWLLDAAFSGVALVAGQTWALAAIALGIIVYRRRFA